GRASRSAPRRRRRRRRGLHGGRRGARGCRRPDCRGRRRHARRADLGEDGLPAPEGRHRHRQQLPVRRDCPLGSGFQLRQPFRTPVRLRGQHRR
ncbi:MAG: hypothetical protein AVDCRST_MAG44-1438, partial [uncultured Sphingomonas sp.]